MKMFPNNKFRCEKEKEKKSQQSRKSVEGAVSLPKMLSRTVMHAMQKANKIHLLYDNI